jgi:hypothetical protein
MKIMNLVFRGSLPLKQGKSYMSECACLGSALGKVFSLHISVVGCPCAERNAVALIVGAHTGEISAPGDSPFEMEDVRRFQVWARRLVMTAILIQPRYWIGISAAIVCMQSWLRLIGGSSGIRKQ